MKVTLDTFQALYTFYAFHPGFLDLIIGMGFKSAPEDEYFASCYRCLRPINLESVDMAISSRYRTSAQKSSSYRKPNLYADFCYRLPYYEKRSREADESWCVRQTVAYHRLDIQKNCSVWVVVQAPEVWESGAQGLWYLSTSHPLILHLRFMRATTARFREYLNYMSTKLLVLVLFPSYPRINAY